MTGRFWVSCLGIVAMCTAVHAQSPQTPATLAITNVAVVDVQAGRILPNQTILVAGNRILSVTPAANTSIPRDARVLNGAGKFVIPGLWDLHSHAVNFGRTALSLYLANGVTSIRDLGAERFADAKAWRDSIAGGQLLGPRMRIASPVVENARWLAAVKRMGEQAGTPWRLYERFGPTSVESAQRWVDSVAALGADQIKVRNWPAPELGKAIVDRARERGLPVAAHGNEPFPRAGLTTLEHGIWPPVTSAAKRDSLWQQLAANRVAIVPTLVTWPIRLDSPDTMIAKLTSGRVAGLEYVPKATRDNWRDAFLEFKQESPMDWTAIYQGEVRNAREMQNAGLTLLAGTDIGAPLVIPGFSLHDELGLLVNVAGMTPLQALQAATMNAAAVAGVLDSLGTVTAAKKADLVLLDQNPLVSITNTRRIHAVIANGRLLDRPQLDRLLTEAKAAAR